MDVRDIRLPRARLAVELHQAKLSMASSRKSGLGLQVAGYWEGKVDGLKAGIDEIDVLIKLIDMEVDHE